MTTFNFRAAKGTQDLAEHAGNVILATTGTKHNPNKYNIRLDKDPDGESIKLAIDFAPDNREVHRGGTRGAGRGSLRGAR